MSETGYGGDSNLFRKERENHVLSEPKVSLLTESETNKFEFQKWRLRRIAETFIAAGSGLGSVFVSACPWNSDELVILLSFPRKPCEEFLFHSFRPWPGQNRQTLSSLDCSSSFSSFSRASLFVRLFHFFIQLDKRDGDTVWRGHPDSIPSRMLKYEGYEDPTQVIKTCDGISIVWIVRINLTLGWNFTALWRCESAMIHSMTKFISRDG